MMKIRQLILMTIWVMLTFLTYACQADETIKAALSGRITVPDDYATITEAVAHADPNATIFIRNGAYTEHFIIDKPLTLEGQSQEQVIIRDSADVYAVIQIEAPAMLRQLTVEHSDHNTKKENTSCIRVIEADFEIDHCTIRKGRHFGIVIKNNGRANVNNCLFEDMPQAGALLVKENPQACTVRHNTFRHCGNGITLMQAPGKIENNVLEDIERGVDIFKVDQVAIVRANRFTRNQMHISVRSDSEGERNTKAFSDVWDENNLTTQPYKAETVIDAFAKTYGDRWAIIEDNDFEQAQAVGVNVLYPNAVALLRNNRCQGDNYGVLIQQGAQAIIVGCTVRACTMNGVRTDSELSSAIVLDNHIIENGQCGVLFTSGTSGYAYGNLVENNKENGLNVDSAKRGFVLSHNHLINNSAYGVVMQNCESDWRIEYNTLKGNIGDGIYLSGSRHDGVIRGNTCAGNHSGIRITNSSTPQIIDNTCSDNSHWGIVVVNDSQANIRNNQVHHNWLEGIYIYGMDCRCDVIANQLSGNYPVGIYFNHQAAGRIESNAVSGHPWAGIALAGVGLDVQVAKNTCNDNGAWGILSYGGAEPEVTNDNITSNNGRGGIEHQRLSVQEKVDEWIRQGWEYHTESRYDLKQRCLQKAVDLSPDNAQAWSSLGWSIMDNISGRKPPQTQKELDQAYRAFVRAWQLDPEIVESLWGMTVTLNDGAITDAQGRQAAYEQLDHAYDRLLTGTHGVERVLNYSHSRMNWLKSKNPNNLERLIVNVQVIMEQAAARGHSDELLYNLGDVYIESSRLLKEEKTKYLKLAVKALLRISPEGRKTSPVCYNLACLYALLDDEINCRQQLLDAQDNGQLPSREHVMQDRDLESVRKKPWFRELQWPQDEKETEQLEIPKDF